MVGGIAPLWRPQAASGPATGDRADRAARRAAATRRMAGRAQGSTGYTAEGVWPRGANRDHRSIATAPSRRSRSTEHTSELQSLMRISYAVFCMKKQNHTLQRHKHNQKSHT